MSKRSRSSTAPDEIIRLSVAGTLFTTTRSTLCAARGSMLAAKFQEDSPFGEPLTDEAGNVFIDRNPESFAIILEFLRNGCILVDKPPERLLKVLRADADYFGLDCLLAALDPPVEALQLCCESLKWNFEEKGFVPPWDIDHLVNAVFVRTDEMVCGAPVFEMFGNSTYVLRRHEDKDSAKVEWIVTDRQYDGTANGYIFCMTAKTRPEDIKDENWRVLRFRESPDSPRQAPFSRRLVGLHLRVVEKPQ